MIAVLGVWNQVLAMLTHAMVVWMRVRRQRARADDEGVFFPSHPLPRDGGVIHGVRGLGGV